MHEKDGVSVSSLCSETPNIPKYLVVFLCPSGRISGK